MSTACLIGRPTGPAGMKAVYCHWDGNPSAMVPILRRLVLDTFEGHPAAAADYLFAFSGFGYWSTLTGAGDPYSAAMRAESADGAVQKWTGAPWPDDVDVYQDNPECRDAVLEYRDGAYLDSALLSWPQQWLYILYPRVLAVVRYVAPTEDLGNRLPVGINCEALPWADRITPGRLLGIERRADRQLAALLTARNRYGPHGRGLIATPRSTEVTMTPEFPHIDRPSPVTDVPIVEDRPELRRIQALWPLRNVHSNLDGEGIQYAVLTVTHSTSRRAYGATLNREDRFARTVRVNPFDAAPVGRLTPTGRYSQKSLRAAFAAALQTLRTQIATGDEQLAAYFTPTTP